MLVIGNTQRKQNLGREYEKHPSLRKLTEIPI